MVVGEGRSWRELFLKELKRELRGEEEVDAGGSGKGFLRYGKEKFTLYRRNEFGRKVHLVET